ncbi:MAG TPA: UvrD-helicase domain-containing protein [Alphaproteobacteria bacterium]|nr:UvrD-helicase domain-containing protein [Alphaproteobacteria bacterium]
MKRRMNDAARHDATELQRKALAPSASVWISANAGTGKTEVLTYRIIGLLLADHGLSPANILAVTFTNAAAAEMAARLGELLAHWNALDDGALTAQLREVFGYDVTAAMLARFRQLPALVADAPPTLTTIHGFAQQLLARLPGGSGLPQSFELVEKITDHGLLADALENAVRNASEGETEALNILLAEFGENAWRDLSELFEFEWRNVTGVMNRAGGLGPYMQRLMAELGLDGSEENMAAQMLPTADEKAALQVFDAGVLSARDDEALLRNWKEFLFIAKGEGTPAVRGFPGVKAAVEANPEAAQVLRDAQARVDVLRDRQRGWQSFTLTRALLVWWNAVRVALDALKDARRLKTFGDLLDELELRLEEAAADTARGQWLWQRLERNYSHLLADEAQDNNPQQGRLVQLLARVFLSGDVGTGSRTVLAVGDVKQSIYRFQGARPELFAELQDFLRGWSSALHPLVTVQSAYSFRSSWPLLQAVESVFAGSEARAAVGGWLAHRTVFPDDWGRVEIWPPLEVPPKTEQPAFAVEAQPRTLADGANLQAVQLAEWLMAQKNSRVVLPSTGAPLGWGDVLVIVQRNETAMAMAGALSAAGVPAVAVGAKRAHAVPPLVADVMALARYINGPADRLALAQVLKSPLCNWSDAQLLALAEADWKLNGATADWLAHWRGRAVAVPPGEWLAELAQRQEIVDAYVVRGPLPLAVVRAALAGLVEDAQGYSSLPQLLAAWEDTPPLPAAGGTQNAVTVTTVHKAKGLGYPLVVVAETAIDTRLQNKLAWHENDAGEPDSLLLRRSKEMAPRLQTAWDDAEKARAVADRWRGLYVALTRAKDWLVVCNWQAEGANPKDNNWYGWITAGVDGNWRDENGMKVLEQGKPHYADKVEAAVEAPLPAVATPQPLQPFVWPEEEPFVPEREAAMARGTLQHRQLHALALLPPTQREGDAAVLAVFEKFPELFAAGSRGEVPIVVNGGEGFIDRLVEYGDEVWIIDFKTEAEVPDAIPAKYAAQLQRYAAAIAPAFAGKRIKCGIVWLGNTQLQWLP